MCVILNSLIVIFVLLIGTQIFLAYSGNIIEGLDDTSSSSNSSKNYQEYNGDDALILSKQNAANIEFLKQQFDGINGLQSEVNDISSNVVALQTQVDGLVQSQQDYTNNITSSNSELSTSYSENDSNEDTTTPDGTTSTTASTTTTST
jgi:peptidoglycan hydrolase CwlO-like protein